VALGLHNARRQRSSPPTLDGVPCEPDPCGPAIHSACRACVRLRESAARRR